MTRNENKLPNAAQTSYTPSKRLFRDALIFFPHTRRARVWILWIHRFTFMAMIYLSMSSGMAFGSNLIARLRLCFTPNKVKSKELELLSMTWFGCVCVCGFASDVVLLSLDFVGIRLIWMALELNQINKVILSAGGTIVPWLLGTYGHRLV